MFVLDIRSVELGLGASEDEELRQPRILQERSDDHE